MAVYEGKLEITHEQWRGRLEGWIGVAEERRKLEVNRMRNEVYGEEILALELQILTIS